MGWEGVDEGWGHGAVDYAYLLEAQMWREYLEILDACAVGPGVRMLDVGCGPGLAVRLAMERGAEASGLDASPRLITVAHARCPDADLRVGDMFAMPFDDESFDVVTAFRSIWGGCEGALAEATRVCRPGGRVGISFWGNAKHMNSYPLLRLFGHVDEHERAHAKEMANIAWDGVAEQMMVDAGLGPGQRWVRSIVLEYPDVELAARAWASSGPAYLAMRAMGQEPFLAAARDAARQFEVPGAGVRFELRVQFLAGKKPGLSRR
jgi:SAM-dependent methyltransferase